MPDAPVTGSGVAAPQGTVQPAPQPVPAPVTAAPSPVSGGDTPPSTSTPSTNGDALPQGMTRGSDGKIRYLSDAVFKRLKEEAREKGRKDALSTFAKEAGFTSVDDLKTALGNLKAPPSTPNPDPKASPTPDHSRSDKWERERTQLQRQIDDLSRRVKTESEGKKELQRQLDAKEAEMELREAAVIAGIKDPDYAIRLLTRSLENKSEEDLEKFDHAKFFSELRGSHPYLFGEVAKPATTGTGVGAPAAPKPGEATSANAQNGKVDATKMKPEEFREYLARRGLGITV